MADQVLTKQKLINADEDLGDLEEVLNGPPGKIIKTRLGREVYTLASVPQINTMTREEVTAAVAPKANKIEVDATLAAYVGGRKAYTTLALAQAAQASLPANTAIEVTNDGENNGTYQWNGTTLTKSQYDPITQSKLNNWEDINNALNNINPDYSTLVNSWDSTVLVNTGYLLQKNGVMAQTPSPTDKSSGFIQVQAGQTVIVVANVGPLHSPICFYLTVSEESFVESVSGVDPAAKPRLYMYTPRENGYIRVFSSSTDNKDSFLYFYLKIYGSVSRSAPRYEDYLATKNTIDLFEANLRYEISPDDASHNSSILSVWGTLIDANGKPLGSGNFADRVSEYIPVTAGKVIIVNASVSDENSVIAFYSAMSEFSFVTSVVGSDNTRDKPYRFVVPSDGYVRLYSSSYADADAFDKYSATITTNKKIYVTPEDLQNGGGIIGSTPSVGHSSAESFFSTDMAKPTTNFGDSKGTLKGIVLRPSANSSDFDSLEVESPYIIFDEKIQKYVMVYTAYGQGHVSAIGWATSVDLENWTKQGVLLNPSGIAANGDQYGVTGPCIYYYLGTYYLYYLGLGGAGYEGEPINMCLATTPSLTSPVWTYHGISIPIQSNVSWANSAIYHPNLFFYREKWWMFFNARGNIDGVVAERFGYATSESIDGPWVVANERVSQNLEIHGTFILAGDPVIFDYKGLLYCFYFSVLPGGTAVDQWAWTTPAEFPRGWRRGGYLLNTSPPQQSTYAHKPFVVKKDNTLYHYYTAVGDQGRLIALKTYPI